MSVKANCLPEMKKDHVYKVLMSLDTSWDIVAAECGCHSSADEVVYKLPV